MEQPDTKPRRTNELSRRYERQRRLGLALSVLVHVLLFLVFSRTGVPANPFAAAGPRAGDDRAAAGGGLEVVTVPAATRVAEIVRPPEPLNAPEITLEPIDDPDPQIEPVDFDRAPALGGGEAGVEAGEPGLEEGDGRGDGGTAEEGRNRAVPPVPRGMIMPPSDRPDELRGREVEVWVWVTVQGEVVPDSTRIVPSTGDGGFDDRLEDQAAEWVFEPAQRDGEPVASWFKYVITL